MINFAAMKFAHKQTVLLDLLLSVVSLVADWALKYQPPI